MVEGRELIRWWRGRNEGVKEKERCERVYVSVCAHTSSWCLMNDSGANILLLLMR